MCSYVRVEEAQAVARELGVACGEVDERGLCDEGREVYARGVGGVVRQVDVRWAGGVVRPEDGGWAG